MKQNDNHAGNVLLIRGACLWILMALLLAWSLVGIYNQIGFLENSSLFLLYAMFPVLDPLSETFTPAGVWFTAFNIYLYSSLLITSYGFGKAAVIIFRTTLENDSSAKNCKRCGRHLM